MLFVWTLSRNILQLLLGDPDMLNQLDEMYCPSCVLWVSNQLDSPGRLQKNAPMMHQDQMSKPPQLAAFDVVQESKPAAGSLGSAHLNVVSCGFTLVTE